MPVDMMTVRENVVLTSLLVGALSGAGCASHGRVAAGLRPVREYDQTGARWADQSPHRAGFVTANGARLHYLDWGGRGEAVVLLAGVTMTPHVYDDLAPALSDRFHVVGITRRGHGESERSAGGYELDTLVEDLRAVLDSLGLRRAHLVGHSIAGAEITAFALKYPERVGKLVYLDAAVAAPPMPPRREMEDPIPEPPRPKDWDTSAAFLRGWVSDALHRGRWSDALESNLRVRHGGPDGRFHDALAPGVVDAIFEARSNFHPDLARLRAPALGLYSSDEEHPLVHLARDDSTRRLAREYVEIRLRPRAEVIRAQFETLPNGKLVVVPGGIDHYFFVTQPALVLAQLREFLGGPRP